MSQGIEPSRCVNCGKPGPHFIGPSFGDPGYFACAPMRTFVPLSGHVTCKRCLSKDEDGQAMVRQCDQCAETQAALNETVSFV